MTNLKPIFDNFPLAADTPVTAVVCPWLENPYRLVNWWEMEKFSAKIFYKIGQLLERVKTSHELAKVPGDAMFSGSAADRKLNQEQASGLEQFMKSVEGYCGEIGLKMSVKQCNDLRTKAQGLTNRQAVEAIAQVDKLIQWEMEDSLFMFISSDHAKFYNPQQLFGNDVDTKFSKASFNIKEAGNCLALNRATAAVFHLMSALEVPLDSLAHALGLPYSQKNWETILRDIEQQIQAISPGSGPNWKTDKEFFGQAALEFRFFKDAWRNHTMHARAKYDWDEAKLISEHVKAFMVHLATRLQERP